MHAGVQFSVLGPVRLHRQGIVAAAGQPRQCAVLASLLLRSGNPVSLATLVEDVWGDDAPPSAIGSVRTYVYRIRQALAGHPDSSVRLVEGGYALRFRPEALDLNRFKQTAAQAREAKAEGDLARSTSLLTQALGMWHGYALAGVPGPFADAQRTALGDLRLACLEDRLGCEVESGHYTEAAAELSALLVEHPLRERLCELLMTALYGAGRQSEALTVYHTTSHLLRQRLGVDPSPALQQVHERILSGRFALPHPPAQPVSGRRAAPPTTPAQLPPSLPGLVGREGDHERIERLADIAAAASSVGVCVVGGMAGVGKTAFATAAAHRLAHRFPDGQLFTDLQGSCSSGTPRDPAAVLGDLLQSLGVNAADVPETRQARVLAFRGLLANRRVLVVLDDAYDSDQVRDLIPGSPGSMALVTSRMQLHNLVAAHAATPLTLMPLGQADARSLLAQRLGESRTAEDPAAVDRIIRVAAHLPLALANVAARAAFRPQIRLESLAAEYESAGSSALDAFTADEDPSLDVRASLARSYSRLDAESAHLFRSLSSCPTPLFALSQVVHLTAHTEQRARRLLSHLTRTHLVCEVGPGRYSWNRLVAAFATELADRAFPHARCPGITRGPKPVPPARAVHAADAMEATGVAAEHPPQPRIRRHTS
ncbi:BTAD domain-containing putative transcriptional regulator [Streptomyces sp. Lzd4kr]|nr:BTAD domain-containing putative transcriptional regulator [Streptomyces sp. Lzd4kr]